MTFQRITLFLWRFYYQDKNWCPCYMRLIIRRFLYIETVQDVFQPLQKACEFLYAVAYMQCTEIIYKYLIIVSSRAPKVPLASSRAPKVPLAFSRAPKVPFIY